MTLKLTLAPEPGTAPASAETQSNLAWHDTEVRVRLSLALPGGSPLVLDTVVANAAPDGSLVSAWAIVPPATATLLHVRRYGPHRYPFQWTTATPFAVSDGMKITPVERRRISAWANASRLLDASSLDLNATFAGHQLTGLDDISLVSTVFLQDDNSINWAADFPGPEMREVIIDVHNKTGKQTKNLTPAERTAILTPALETAMKNLVNRLHAKRVQVFAGFYVDSGNPGTVAQAHAARLLAFVRSKPDWVKFARDLFDFFESRSLEIDGIWFDFEVASFNQGDKPEIEKLLHAVADTFGERGRTVAFAAAPDSNGNVAKHFLSHPASLGQYPNILVRPMSYDTRPAKVNGVDQICVLGQPISATSLDQVLDQCLTRYGLHPAQVQLGVGLCDNTSGPHVLGLLRKWSKALRNTRAGIIHWNLQNQADADVYVECDRNLNGDGSTVLVERGTFGQPIHGPFNRDRVDAMNAVLPANQQIVSVIDSD
jgi:hypothetical protein